MHLDVLQWRIATKINHSFMCACILMHSLTDILTHTLPYTYALRLTHTSSSPKHRDLVQFVVLDLEQHLLL